MDTDLDLEKYLSDIEKFQHFSQEAEENERFQDAVDICDEASQKIKIILQRYGSVMDPQIRLNYEYNSKIAVLRKQWLIGTINARKLHPVIDSSDSSDAGSDNEEFLSVSSKQLTNSGSGAKFTFLAPEDIPYVSWDSVIGIDRAKTELQKALSTPFDYPDSEQAKKASTGILIFGPGGVGKTHVIRAVVANEIYKFFNVEVDSVLSHWQGKSPNLIRQLFTEARKHAPSIVFIDECDLLCRTRDAVDGDGMRAIKTKLLTEMDGLVKSKSRVIVIGTTNTPWELDHAFRRRFKKRIYADLPNDVDRVKLLEKFLSKYRHNVTPNQVLKIAKRCERYSGADLEELVDTAGSVQLNEVYGDKKKKKKHGLRIINVDDMKLAYQSSRSTVDPSYIAQLEAWNEKFGGGVKGELLILSEDTPPKKVPWIVTVFSAIHGFVFGRYY